MTSRRCWLSLLGVVFAISHIQAQHAGAAGAPKLANAPIYQNAKALIDARVADLVARMTLEEKVAQLEVPLGWPMYRRGDERVDVSEAFKAALKASEPGSLYGVFRADPWTKVTVQTGLSPRQSAEAANALQRYAIEHSRLHVPLLLTEECPHGHMAIGATTFPTAIGQASTWNPALIEKLASAVGRETRAGGANVCYGPILDIAREPRWSRVEETYGEDPYLVTQMGVAFVHGLQGTSLQSQDSVAATLKHFAGYGTPEGGHNSGTSHAGPREMQMVFLPAFKAGVEAGAVSLMSSYNAIDGMPSSANPSLLTDLLRGQWGFKGFVVSDLYAIDGLASGHHVAANLEEAATMSLTAGIDSDLGASAFPHLVQAVLEKKISVVAIDRAVARVLRVKFELGLFDSPYVDAGLASQVIHRPDHVELARQAARESIVLLKNANAALPLRKDIESIAVIGPNADSVYNQLGDYTAPQTEGKVTTVLQGIRKAVGSGTVVRYAKGCGIRDMSEAQFAEALSAVKASAVSVVVLGGSSARNFDTAFAATGAATPEMRANGSDMESGEGFDRSTLGLAGVQEKLLEQIVAIGKPVILVLIEGRPLTLPSAAERASAILDAWYPGEAGGLAIADVLFGAYNPAGRLPISIPRSSGQLPVYYGQARQDYIDMSGSPQYPFGYGLSYASFRYTNLRLTTVSSKNGAGEEVLIDISNTAGVAGDEVVQLYLHPVRSSVVTPLKALRGFDRIHLEPGETRTVRFLLKPADLSVYDRNQRWTAEPGTYQVMIGASSEDIRTTGQIEWKAVASGQNAQNVKRHK